MTPRQALRLAPRAGPEFRREWISADDEDRGFDLFDQSTESGQPVKAPRQDVCILRVDLD